MALTDDDVRHVAKLAKLGLTDSEVKKFSQQLSAVVEYIQQLNEVDTKGTEPTSQTTHLAGVTREDIVKPDPALSPEAALSGTEDIHNDYFVTQAVIEKNA